MATKPTAVRAAEVHIIKNGPNGRPAAQVLVDPKTTVEQAASAVIKVTRSTDLLKKVGLRACNSCISGFDIWIRHRYDQVINVDMG
jgi:hypothetical protein